MRRRRNSGGAGGQQRETRPSRTSGPGQAQSPETVAQSMSISVHAGLSRLTVANKGRMIRVVGNMRGDPNCRERAFGKEGVRSMATTTLARDALRRLTRSGAPQAVLALLIGAAPACKLASTRPT